MLRAAGEFAKIEFADDRFVMGAARSPSPSARAPERQGRVVSPQPVRAAAERERKGAGAGEM